MGLSLSIGEKKILSEVFQSRIHLLPPRDRLSLARCCRFCAEIAFYQLEKHFIEDFKSKWISTLPVCDLAFILLSLDVDTVSANEMRHCLPMELSRWKYAKPEEREKPDIHPTSMWSLLRLDAHYDESVDCHLFSDLMERNGALYIQFTASGCFHYEFSHDVVMREKNGRLSMSRTGDVLFPQAECILNRLFTALSHNRSMGSWSTSQSYFDLKCISNEQVVEHACADEPQQEMDVSVVTSQSRHLMQQLLPLSDDNLIALSGQMEKAANLFQHCWEQVVSPKIKARY